MDTICGGSVQACATRIARLNTNGSLDEGTDGMYVSDGLVSFTFEPEISAGEDFELKSACGDPYVTFQDCDRVKRYNIGLTHAEADPELEEILLSGGAQLLLSGGGETRGVAAPVLGVASCPPGVSLEFWTKHIVDGEQDNDWPWIHWLFTRVKLQVGARTIGNEVMQFPYTGRATQNDNWGTGPNGEWTPYASTRAWQRIYETEIPLVACGYQTLAAGS